MKAISQIKTNKLYSLMCFLLILLALIALPFIIRYIPQNGIILQLIEGKEDSITDIIIRPYPGLRQSLKTPVTLDPAQRNAFLRMLKRDTVRWRPNHPESSEMYIAELIDSHGRQYRLDLNPTINQGFLISDYGENAFLNQGNYRNDGLGVLVKEWIKEKKDN